MGKYCLFDSNIIEDIEIKIQEIVKRDLCSDPSSFEYEIFDRLEVDSKYDYAENDIYVSKDLKKVLKNKMTVVKKNFIDHYLYFISTLHYLKYVNKKFKDSEYQNINYKIMSKIISEKKYSEIVGNLIQWGIIATDNTFRKNEKSIGYKVLPPFNNNIRKIKIKDKLINRKINKHRKEQEEKSICWPDQYQYLKRMLKWIEIDENEANKYNLINYLGQCNKKGSYNTKYDSNFIAIDNLRNKNYFYTVDSFGERFHSNLTNLNRNLRYTLSVQGEKLGQVDIKNSQPLFFYLFIKDLPYIPDQEKEEFKKIVENGLFYEFFMAHFNIPSEKRNKKKRHIITGLFSDKNKGEKNRYFECLKEKFPHIAELILVIKKQDYKLLIKLMQLEESRFVIRKVIREFIKRYNGQFISTIHDSIVVKASMLDQVYELILECFSSYGIKPKLDKKIFMKEISS